MCMGGIEPRTCWNKHAMHGCVAGACVCVVYTWSWADLVSAHSSILVWVEMGRDIPSGIFEAQALQTFSFSYSSYNNSVYNEYVRFLLC